MENVGLGHFENFGRKIHQFLKDYLPMGGVSPSAWQMSDAASL